MLCYPHTTRHYYRSARVSSFRPGASPGSGQPTPQGWPLRDLPVGRPLPFARAEAVSWQGLSGVSCSMRYPVLLPAFGLAAGSGPISITGCGAWTKTGF